MVSFVLALPLALPLYSALGGDGLPLLTLLLIYSSFGLAALVAAAGNALQRTLIALTASCLAAALFVGALLPRYNADSPQRLNLQYRLDADTQQAQWIADPLAGSPPAALLQRHALHATSAVADGSRCPGMDQRRATAAVAAAAVDASWAARPAARGCTTGFMLLRRARHRSSHWHLRPKRRSRPWS